MPLTDIISLAKDVTDLGSVVQTRGDILYRASIALEEFKRDLTEFERQQNSWQRRIKKYGLSVDETTVNALGRAQTLLQKEQERLKSLDSWWCFGCLFMLCGLTFPPELAESLQNLNKTIQRDLQEEGLADADAEDRVKVIASHEAFRFREDNRYVPLPHIEDKIRDALEGKGEIRNTSRQISFDNAGDVRVVLLEGRAGTGKSSMARYLALKYQTSNAADSMPDSSTSTAHRYCSVFDKVVYLECGEKIDLLAKQVELVKFLDWKGSLEEKDTNKQDWAQYLKSDEQRSVAQRVKGILKHLLKERRILIILDDVWNGYFVEDIAGFLGADGSRILVTSQISTLCHKFSTPGLQWRSVSMDSITNENALQILQVHAGFTSNETIPEPVTVCMTNLIKEVSTNPHALASVAAAIDKSRSGQEDEWLNLIEAVEQNELRMKAVLHDTRFQGTKYSSSIGVKFSLLGEEESNLVVLAAMLDGPSVPEKVIQLLHAEMCNSGDLEAHRSAAFSSARKRLEDLQCIKTAEVDVEFVWSIHFLDRAFLESTMAPNMHSFVEKYKQLRRKKQGLEEEPQEHLVKILGALYLRSEWGEPITRVFGGWPLARGERAFVITARIAIQGIVNLMGRRIRKDWALEERSSADQVFLDYMCQGRLHEDAVKVLLRCDISKHVLLDTVIKFVELSDISLSESLLMTMLGVKGDLAYIDADGNALKLNLEQCKLLHSLARRGGDIDGHLVRKSLCVRSVVLGLLDRSRAHHQSYLRYLAVHTLGYLGRGYEPSLGEDRVAFLVLQFPGLVNKLASVLEEDTLPFLQQAAAWSLFQFARNAKDYGGVKWAIIERSAEQLVRSVGQNNNAGLQRWAVAALSSLANGGRRISLGILRFPHAIDYILEMLRPQSSHEEFDVAKSVALSTIRNIMAGILPSSDADLGLISRVSQCLVQLLRGDLPEAAEGPVLQALTRVDTLKAINLQLVSGQAYRARGRTLVELGHFKAGLRDLKKADELYDYNDFETCRYLMVAKAKLGDQDSALWYADRALGLAHKSRLHFHIAIAFQERGVLKRMMGDLEGALRDLDDGLKLAPNDYTRLKQRAYVKYLKGDEEGALKDAKESISFIPSWYDRPLIEHNGLGTATVVFLNFRLI